MVEYQAFEQFIKSRDIHMGLFSNCLVTIQHNIEAFVWHLFQPVIPELCSKNKEKRKSYFSLKQKIDLLRGNTIKRKGKGGKSAKTYCLTTPVISIQLWDYLTNLKEQRNLIAHEVDYLYKGIFDFVPIRAKFGLLTMELAEAMPELAIDLPKEMQFEASLNSDALQRRLTFRMADKNTDVNLELKACSKQRANIILNFWRKEVAVTNGKIAAEKAPHEYLLHLLLGRSEVWFPLKKSQFKKLQAGNAEIPKRIDFWELCYCFEKKHLFELVATLDRQAPPIT